MAGRTVVPSLIMALSALCSVLAPASAQELLDAARAGDVEAVRVLNCSVFAVGRDGIILNGTDSTISRCNVHDTGCGGIKTTGGACAR